MLAYNLFIFLRENKVKLPVGSYNSPEYTQNSRGASMTAEEDLSLRVVYKSQAIIDISFPFTMI